MPCLAHRHYAEDSVRDSILAEFYVTSVLGVSGSIATCAC